MQDRQPMRMHLISRLAKLEKMPAGQPPTVSGEATDEFAWSFSLPWVVSD